ncbi:ABC transporter ATP-binding protein [uncultured Clostridium sp.]|uniref:ABC transporter ATP-binding protein n=1 Tax=uncultured Clostridium sp. TaxID=59620 RepID=UPI0028EE8D5B|nr:ABC transporter ATP-binding protein [uncultured Clostridium sp.]
MAIKLKNIIKRYGNNLAVDNISLDIEDGEIFGLLGPNGAGKSTAIKMIMGLLKPNSGEIFINGIDVMKNSLESKKILGLVPQELAIYENMTAMENVEFLGKLYGLRGKKLKEMAEEALQFTGLIEKRKEVPKKFSGGMKRRLNIACAIVHEPKIIIMDEPTVGIDPQSRNHILESIKELNRRGTTIIYTSHYMEEVESICSRVGIIDFGKLIALGSKEELVSSISEEQKIIIEGYNISFNPIDEIKKIEEVDEVNLKGNRIEVICKSPNEILQRVLVKLGEGNVVVRNIDIKQADLESVFLKLTGRKLRD